MFGRRQRQEHPVPDTLCLLPWVNLSVDVDGTSRPCCKFDHVDSVDGRTLLNLRDASLGEVWQSDGLVELRRQFRAGERPVACDSCWREEAAGIPSFRQTFLGDRGIDGDVDVDDLHPSQPKGLDLKLSNTCNLACRICGPVASSRWLNEELRAAPEDRPRGSFVAFLADNKRYLADRKLTGRPDDLELLRTWAPEVQHLELTGGEPMLAKEGIEVLELLAEFGRPDRISLQITTNATVIDERITERIPLFREVTISPSIDDIGARLEYQRHPAVWTEVESNLARLAGLSTDRCQIIINATVSAFNAWDLPDFLRWWRTTYPDEQIGMHLNFLHHPTEQCAQQLPETLKSRIADRWERHPAAADPRLAEYLQSALGFLRAVPAEPEHWARFVRSTDDLDRRRSQSFADVYPELSDVLQELGLATPGRSATAPT